LYRIKDSIRYNRFSFIKTSNLNIYPIGISDGRQGVKSYLSTFPIKIKYNNLSNGEIHIYYNNEIKKKIILSEASVKLDCEENIGRLASGNYSIKYFKERYENFPNGNDSIDFKIVESGIGDGRSELSINTIPTFEYHEFRRLKEINNIEDSFLILYDFNSNLSNLVLIQGFINSNITTQQKIPSLSTSSLNILNSGNITGVNTINASTGIFKSISTTNGGSVSIPETGFFGGLGDKIILSTGGPTIYPYSIGIETNSLWLSSPNDIKFYNNGSNTLSILQNKDLICSGNITGVNTINASTGIFKSISTTNGGSESIPETGFFGGLGDKLIISTGGPTIYPYSIGIETNSLWLSSPIDIKFYNNGSNTVSILQNKDLICYGNIKENDIYIKDVYASSNLLYDTCNILLNQINSNDLNMSNSLYDTSNILLNQMNSNYYNNSNFIIETSNILLNNLINNYSKNIIVKIPNTNFTYDGTNELFIYDLDIRPYVLNTITELTIGSFVKTKIFRITSVISFDFKNLENLNLNNVLGQAICFPETLTIYMSNMKNILGSTYDIINDDTYCNGIVYGKQNPKLNIGYWNILENNFNYIRFITRIGFTMLIIIEPVII
jgi:hypothetical protein